MERSDVRTKLLAAGSDLMLTHGYRGVGIDAVCATAGVTKGAFFHYFNSKDAFAEAVLGHYWTTTQAALQAMPFAKLDDPLQRVHAYLDVFVALSEDPDAEKSCLFGNVAQEVAPTNADLRAACRRGFEAWAAQIAAELEAAKEAHQPLVDFDSKSVARHFIAVYEGSLVLVKARGRGTVLAENVEHFRAYLNSLFGRERGKKRARGSHQR